MKKTDNENREMKDGTYNRHEIIITAQNGDCDYVKDASHGRPELPENGELYHYNVAIQSWRSEQPPCGRSKDSHFEVQDDTTTFTYEEAVKVAEELETKWSGPRLLDLDDAQGALALVSPADFIGFATYITTTILQGSPGATGYPQTLKRLRDNGWGSEPELFQFVGVCAAVAHSALRVRADYDDTIERGIYIDIVDDYAERWCAWLDAETINERDPWDAREIDIRNLMHSAVDQMRDLNDQESDMVKEASA
jgi:hypothetical protein